MALKTTNKNRKVVEGVWKPLDKLVPKETEETLKKFVEDNGIDIKW